LMGKIYGIWQIFGKKHSGRILKGIFAAHIWQFWLVFLGVCDRKKRPLHIWVRNKTAINDVREHSQHLLHNFTALFLGMAQNSWPFFGMLRNTLW
jgi:hypothetical protein